MKVAIIDYGVGNLGSVARSLEKLNTTPLLVDDPSNLHIGDRLILPGVGNFTDCATILNEKNWTQAIIKEVTQNGKPLLGICLGMQLLASYGTEGSTEEDYKGTKGLGLIPGSVKSLKELGCSLRIPHVGWNEAIIKSSTSGLFNGIPNHTDFYFVHSYAFTPSDAEHTIATCDYDISIVAAVRHKNIWGTQFHPEKSSRAGFKLLQNFINNPLC